MSDEKNEKINLNDRVKREFKATSIALKNRTSVFVLTFAIIIFGLLSYKSLPKELFPDVAFPWVMVQTIYPGNPPIDMENLVTRPIEKEIESIDGINNIESTSAQDMSFVLVEFNGDVEIDAALQDVKDAVDRAQDDLPDDLPSDPLVMDIDASEFPIINLNLSGDYSTNELKKYGEKLQDKIESVSEISKVEIQGINDREIHINVDQHKLEAFDLSFTDIENAISFENMSVSGGELKLNGTQRSVRTIGEFTSIEEMENIIVKNEENNIVYLRDLAEVVDGFEDPSSYTWLENKPVVSLQVVKKGGENLLNAIDKIKEILDEVKEQHTLPEDLEITITNDQSDMIKKQLNNLENSMIISVIFVISVLFFFLGTRNALFVGLAIPMSMFLSFLVLQVIDFRINMMVLFGLILALGMLVDNAIVVVENIYRFIDQGYSRFEAAKQAVGEIAVPIIASTMTTLAAFVPLAFWDSMMGEFMKFLPITLIIVLTSSLFVALVIIPVLSAVFIKKVEDDKPPERKSVFKISGFLIVLAVVFYATGVFVAANLLMLVALILILNTLFLSRLARWFKKDGLSWLELKYSRFLGFALTKRNPFYFLGATILLLVFTIMFFNARNPDIMLFPDNEPNYINVLAELPVGTDINETNEFALELDSTVKELSKPYDSIIKSVLTNVGDGAVLQNSMEFTTKENRCMVTVSFVDYKDRGDLSTAELFMMVSEHLLGKYPGVEFTFEKDNMGPPTGRPINLEVVGPDYDKLILLTEDIQTKIDKAQIEGIEGLKMDLNIGKPEMIVTIDRDKARRFGMSTGQIASTIRTALFGKEISDYKVGEDEYPIRLRLKNQYRNDISSLMNQMITFRNNMGKLMKIPISAVASYNFSSTYGEVKRKDLDRMVTIYSNVLEGYNANNVNNEIKKVIEDYEMPQGYYYKFTGEQEDQAESSEFLSRAMMIAVALILIILVSQFNSLVKPFIILFSILLSTIGVFGGLTTFNMDFIVIMTGIGIISLAGVVVNNAIVLIDYIDLLKARRRKELCLEEEAFLPVNVATECVMQAGKTRLRPVLLTAITTILGLLPMAIGLNIDFAGMLSNFDPQISFGGDMTRIWSPISWTVIFGLSFATFLTLIIVPVMYRLTILGNKGVYFLRDWLKKRLSN